MKPGRGRTITRGLMAVLALVAISAAGTPAAAKKFSGTKKANSFVGTKRADVMRLGAGNDRAAGRGGGDRIMGGKGRDRLNGGKGRDRVNGGKGSDRLAGGPGNDILNAVDRRRDGAVNGGAGRNTCRIDQADLPRVKRCFKLTVAPGGGSGPGQGGGSGGGGTPSGGSDGELQLVSATGLSCASSLPTCFFEIVGTGADSAVGTVTGEGGVSPGLGLGLAVSEPDWTARGTYGCTADGFLRVTIGSKQVAVPVTCTGAS